MNIFSEQVRLWLPIPKSELKNYFEDKLGDVQKAFPSLTDDQREFLITGLTGEQFSGVFES